MSRVPILILHACGSNRDRDAAIAVELAGGEPKIVHMNRFLRGQNRLENYAAVLLPGGFSYGDALGAGQRLALELRQWLGVELTDFRNAGKPVLGICNGFQALVKAGLLPGQARKQTAGLDSLGISSDSDSVRQSQARKQTRAAGSPGTSSDSDSVGQSQASKQTSEAISPALEPVDGYVGRGQVIEQTTGVDSKPNRTVTLTRNASNLFECRWVTLKVALGVRCGWLQGIEGTLIRCPVAHGEGRFVAANANILSQLEGAQLIAFTYQANGTLPLGSIVSNGNACSVKPTDSANPTNPTNPADSANPTKPTGPPTGANLVNPACPTKPTNSTDFAKSADSVNPTDSVNPHTGANLVYPANPNGSAADIAGICDYGGSVVGLMPHPENHVFDWQRPNGPPGGSGLPLFEAFVEAAR